MPQSTLQTALSCEVLSCRDKKSDAFQLEISATNLGKSPHMKNVWQTPILGISTPLGKRSNSRVSSSASSIWICWLGGGWAIPNQTAAPRNLALFRDGDEIAQLQ
jgi:hypothetical protein